MLIPYWVELFITGVFGIVGITVGTLVIFVLTYRRKPSASERLVVGLSFSEVSFNLCYIFVIVFRNVIGTDPTNLFTQKIFLSIDYFLFGFCLISSYLLVFAATISRYYAICKIHEFKKTFNKRRVNNLVKASYFAGFVQACLNASWKWVPYTLRTVIDIEYAVALGTFLTVDSLAMVLVYVKVIQKFEQLRRRLGIDPKEKPEDRSKPTYKEKEQQTLEVVDTKKQVTLDVQSPKPSLPTALSVSECPYSCSRMPSAADTHASEIAAAAIAVKQNLLKCSNNNNQGTISLPYNSNGLHYDSQNSNQNGANCNSVMNTLSREEKRKKREKQKGRYHYSREVSLSLLIISIIYIVCVTPFTIIYLLNQIGLIKNPFIESMVRILLQLKFVLNPIAYTRSSTFKSRIKRIWHSFRNPKGTPLPSTPSPNKHQRVSSFRRFFGSHASET